MSPLWWGRVTHLNTQLGLWDQPLHEGLDTDQDPFSPPIVFLCTGVQTGEWEEFFLEEVLIVVLH